MTPNLAIEVQRRSGEWHRCTHTFKDTAALMAYAAALRRWIGNPKGNVCNVRVVRIVRPLPRVPVRERTPYSRNAPQARAYRLYMQSSDWHALRNQVMERWGSACLNCGSEAGIIAHHLRYRHPLAMCTTNDVIPLCRDCHDHYHQAKKTNPASVRPIEDAKTAKGMVTELRRMFSETGAINSNTDKVEINRVRIGKPKPRRWKPYKPDAYRFKK